MDQQKLSMDGSSGKRSAGECIGLRKGSCISSKDRMIDRDQRAQFCNRKIGCGGRIKYSQSTKVGRSDKAKCPKPSLYSSNRKEIIGSSSQTCDVMTKANKSSLSSMRKVPSQLESDSSESSVLAESETLELLLSPSTIQSGRQSDMLYGNSGKIVKKEIGSSGVTSNSRPQQIFHHGSGSHNQNSPPVSSSQSVSRNYPCLGARNSSSGSRCSLRNLKCNSTADVVPRSDSTSKLKSSQRDVIQRRCQEGESQLSNKGKKPIAALSVDKNVSPTSGASTSESRHCSSALREDGKGTGSMRTQRSMNTDSRMRLSNRRNGNSSSLAKPAVVISQFPQYEVPFNVGSQSSSQQSPATISSSGSSSYSLSSNNADNLSSVLPFTSAELGITHLTNRDTLQQSNVDGIIEILLALERIEHDDELIREQLLALETNFLLSSLNLYDQHRDMRLDIDNMTYEELLALEERMGTVSTALPEEVLSKCLGRSIYEVTPSEVQVTGSSKDEDDLKCCICQEEYAVGDEIGRLVKCQHRYHTACIHQWLQLKNWCPFCKASAAP